MPDSESTYRVQLVECYPDGGATLQAWDISAADAAAFRANAGEPDTEAYGTAEIVDQITAAGEGRVVFRHNRE